MKRLLVCILAFATVCHARDWSRDFPNEIKSRYFDFHYSRAGWDAKSSAHFLDCFVDIVNRDFFKATFDYPITVLVLPDQDSLQEYLVQKLGIKDPPSFGIYLPRYKLLVTHETAGLGTFASLIVHPLVRRNLPDCPAWAEDGISTFFEKFYGYYDGDSMVVQWGYQNPWRLKALGDRLTHIELRRYVRGLLASLSDDHQSEERLISVFLWQQGKFKRLLQLIAARSHKGYPTYFEAAMGMRLKDITPLWQAYLNDIDSHRIDLLQLPSATILNTRKEFKWFMLINSLPIQPTAK